MAAITRPEDSLDTLAIDIGGTGLKASVLDGTGQMEHPRVRVDTPYPLSPQKLVLELQSLIAGLPSFDRISVGFPGMVRDGRILSAPHFVSPDGPGGTPAPKLVRAWEAFDLAAALEDVTGKPTKVANDADLQGAAVIEGNGFELVVTLGTGVGTAFFSQGQLLPHLELAHHPLRRGKSYNEVLGEAARKKTGNSKWRSRVFETVEVLRALCFFDHCYIGGGNSARLGSDLPAGVSVVDNAAGILGGIKLWDVTRGQAGEMANARHRAVATTPPTPRRRPVRRTATTTSAASATTQAAATSAGDAPPAPRRTPVRRAAATTAAATPTPRRTPVRRAAATTSGAAPAAATRRRRAPAAGS